MAAVTKEERLTLVLVRHAETVANRNDIIQGHTDYPLTESGVISAKLVGRALAQVPWTSVWSSDLPRAVSTACYMLEQCYASWEQASGGSISRSSSGGISSSSGTGGSGSSSDSRGTSSACDAGISRADSSLGGAASSSELGSGSLLDSTSPSLSPDALAALTPTRALASHSASIAVGGSSHGDGQGRVSVPLPLPLPLRLTPLARELHKGFREGSPKATTTEQARALVAKSRGVPPESLVDTAETDQDVILRQQQLVMEIVRHTREQYRAERTDDVSAAGAVGAAATLSSALAARGDDEAAPAADGTTAAASPTFSQTQPHHHGNVLCVTHSGLIKFIVTRVCGVDMTGMAIENCSVTCIDVSWLVTVDGEGSGGDIIPSSITCTAHRDRVSCRPHLTQGEMDDVRADEHRLRGAAATDIAERIQQKGSHAMFPYLFI